MSSDDSAHRPSRWRHVPLGGLFERYGNALVEKRKAIRTGHQPVHSSKSGECITIYPDAGRWYCSSCAAGGDAVTYLMAAEGLSYRQAESRLIGQYGRPPDDLPSVVVNGRQLRVVTLDALAALVGANGEHPRLFARERALVRLVPTATGPLAIEPLDPLAVRNEMTLSADFVRVSRDGRTGAEVRADVIAPLAIAEDILAQSGWDFPALRGIVDRPTLRADGSLLTAPGYDPATGLYLDPAPGLRIGELPEKPTARQVKAAKALVLQPLGEFPFADPLTDRAHALALGFLPFVLEVIGAATPLHLIESPSPGSGKGLLATALTLPGCGANTCLVSTSRQDDEWRKMLLGVLQAGYQAVQFDNVNHLLDQASLCAVLSAWPTWSDRTLGVNTVSTLPIRTVWLATANNPVVSLEVARRTIRCRLDPKVERAWLRDGFHIPKLKEWVTTRRGELIGAYLTLARAWVAAGCPAWSGQPLGTFERWAEVLGGILEYHDIDGFLGNLEAFYEEADTESAAWRRLVAEWWQRHGPGDVGVTELFAIALGVDELTLRGNNERAQRTSFGMQLARRRDATIGHVRIAQAGQQDRASRWRLVPTGAPPPPSGERREDGRHGRTEGHDPAPPADEPTEPRGTFSNPREEREKSTGNRSKKVPLGSVGSSCQTLPVITDDAEAAEVVARLLKAAAVGLDIETCGPGEEGALDPRVGSVRLVQLAAGDDVHIIDLFEVEPGVLAPLFHPTDGPTLVGHNLGFDLSFLAEAGLTVPDGGRLFDTYVVTQILEAGADEPPKGYGTLAAVSERYLGVTLDKSEQTSDWSGPLTAVQIEYARADAAILPRLHHALTKALADAGLRKIAKVEMRCLPAIVWLGRNGAPFDHERWAALGAAAQADVARLDAELHAIVPTITNKRGKDVAVNWASSQQVKRILEARGHDVPNVGEAALIELGREEPIAPLLLKRRAAAKMAGTYGSTWPDKYVHPATGRVHAHWRQIGSRAGRMSCSRPNLQQLPRDKAYRACIRPPEGRVLVKADFSQIELRLVAQVSGDSRLLEAFRAGEDIHAVTASVVLGRTNGEVTAADRQASKAINFGLMYGMGSETLRTHARSGYGVDLTPEEAGRFRQRFFETYPGLRRWHRRHPSQDWETGETIAMDTRTIGGRRRLGVTRFTEKLASAIQGAGADGFKVSMARLWETRDRCPSAIPILAIHDEVVLEVDATEAEQAREWLIDCLTKGMSAFLTDVPVVVDAEIMADWSGTPVEVPS